MIYKYQCMPYITQMPIFNVIRGRCDNFKQCYSTDPFIVQTLVKPRLNIYFFFVLLNYEFIIPLHIIIYDWLEGGCHGDHAAVISLFYLIKHNRYSDWRIICKSRYSTIIFYVSWVIFPMIVCLRWLYSFSCFTKIPEKSICFHYCCAVHDVCK